MRQRIGQRLELLASRATANSAPVGAVGFAMAEFAQSEGIPASPVKKYLLTAALGGTNPSADLYLWGQDSGDVWGILGSASGGGRLGGALITTSAIFPLSDVGALQALYLEVRNVTGTNPTFAAHLTEVIEVED